MQNHKRNPIDLCQCPALHRNFWPYSFGGEHVI